MKWTEDQIANFCESVVRVEKKQSKRLLFKCYNNGSGKTAASIISTLYGFKINRGFSYKDFTAICTSTGNRNTVFNEIQKIRSQYSSTPIEELDKPTNGGSGSEKKEDDGEEESSNTYLWIIGGVVVLIGIGFLVWRKLKK